MGCYIEFYLITAVLDYQVITFQAILWGMSILNTTSSANIVVKWKIRLSIIK